MSTDLQGNSFNFSAIFVERTPIRIIDHSDAKDKAYYDQLVSLVEQMLSLNKQIQDAKTPHGIITIQRRIEATDKLIDTLVYDLYGLTEEEIRLVEDSNPK